MVEIRRRHSLAFKQTALTVLSVFLLGTAISLYQIVADLRSERSSIEQRVTRVLSLVQASAAQAAFDIDQVFAGEIARSLTDHAPIYRVELSNDFGEQLAELERIRRSGALQWVADRLIDPHQSREVSLVIEAAVQPVGTLKVWIDSYEIATPFFDRAILILLSGLVRNLLLSLILVALFYVTLTRPLLETVRSLAAIRPDHPGGRKLATPAGHERDEIGLLVSAGNQVIDAYRAHLQLRNEAQLELQRLRSLLSNVINSMPSALIAVDPDGRVVQWNSEAQRLTGITTDDALGHQAETLSPLLRQEQARIARAIETRQPISDSRREVQLNGNGRLTDITIYPLISNGVDGAVIRIDDVTERVRIEEMMIQSEKMLSVGGLAAGMAHEINNPLAGILQNIQVIRNRISPATERNRKIAEECGISIEQIDNYLRQREIDTMIEMVIDSGKRAARIVNNMLNFSRKSNSGLQRHDLAELLDNAVELASNDYDLKQQHDFRSIEIVRDYPVTPLLLRCDSGEIQQVLLNLLKNAAQALYQAPQQHAAPRITLRIREEPAGMRIDVEDNGPGMEPEVRRRVFEPFFTTKPVGIGTGLGLSVSYFIITEKYHGKMTVESKPGEGSRFIMLLPDEEESS